MDLENKVLSFEELCNGAFVRVASVHGVNHLSVRDIIMVVCQKNNNDAAEVWRRLNDDHRSGLNGYLKFHQFPGRGQSIQPVITFNGAIHLIMILPGQVAREYRVKACAIIQRYLAGDETLVEEIRANAASSAPINLLARESTIPIFRTELKVKRLQLQNKQTLLKHQLQILTQQLRLKDEEIVRIQARRVQLSVIDRQRLWGVYYGEESQSSACILDGFRRVYSTYSGYDASHVQARASGGSDEIWNLLPICSGCNNAMGTMHAFDWIVNHGPKLVAESSTNLSPKQPLPRNLIRNLFFKMFALYKTNNNNCSVTEFIEIANISSNVTRVFLED